MKLILPLLTLSLVALAQTQPTLTRQTKLGCPASTVAVQSIAQPTSASGPGQLTCIQFDGQTLQLTGTTLRAVLPALSPSPAGTYGNATTVPAITVDANGRVTNVAQVPIQAGGGNVAFADAETPTGNIDGTNVTFTLAFAPNPAVSLQLCRNGLLLRAGIDYTLSGNTVTFLNTANTVPQPGDIVQASYRH